MGKTFTIQKMDEHITLLEIELYGKEVVGKLVYSKFI